MIFFEKTNITLPVRNENQPVRCFKISVLRGIPPGVESKKDFDRFCRNPFFVSSQCTAEKRSKRTGISGSISLGKTRRIPADRCPFLFRWVCSAGSLLCVPLIMSTSSCLLCTPNLHRPAPQPRQPECMAEARERGEGQPGYRQTGIGVCQELKASTPARIGVALRSLIVGSTGSLNG